MSNILDLENCSWPDDYSLETPVIKSSLSADLLTVGELKPLALKRYGYQLQIPVSRLGSR